MKISDFLNADMLDLDLSASDTESCLRKLVDILEQDNLIRSPEEVFQKLLEREKVMSTGIGMEVAIPHARCPSLSRTIVTIAVSSKGIEFKAIDGKPVKIIFLIVGPPEAASLHVKLLAQIARMIKSKDFTEELLQAKTGDKIVEIIQRKEMEETKENGVE
jgi:PTS system fructose-specific IIC component